MRDPAAGAAAATAIMARKRQERQDRLRDVTQRLVIAWVLAGTCLVGHLLHCWPGLYGAPPFVQFLANSNLHAVLSAATLLGPGRAILVDG